MSGRTVHGHGGQLRGRGSWHAAALSIERHERAGRGRVRSETAQGQRARNLKGTTACAWTCATDSHDALRELSSSSPTHLRSRRRGPRHVTAALGARTNDTMAATKGRALPLSALSKLALLMLAMVAAVPHGNERCTEGEC